MLLGEADARAVIRRLREFDRHAIHLVTALRLADDKVIDAVMTYDTRFADGARAHGLTVVAPA